MITLTQRLLIDLEYFMEVTFRCFCVSNVSYFLDLSSCLLNPSGHGYDEPRMLGHSQRLLFLESCMEADMCTGRIFHSSRRDFAPPIMEHKVLLSLSEDLHDFSLVPVICNDHIIL